MEEVVLRMEYAGYRHSIYSPRLLQPWHTRPGPGVFSAELSLYEGSILGLVGPNGAGKTTLLRLLAGILPLQKGKICAGEEQEPISSQELRMKVGHMPEQVRWQGKKSVQQALLELGEMRHADQNHIEQLLKLVGLQSRMSSPLNELSQGMRQRLTLAAALLGSPRILLLDEPLNGLDPVASEAFVLLLRKLTQKGVSIVISSHRVDGLVGLIDRLALMHQGQILAEGTMNDVARDLGLKDKTEMRGKGQMPEFTKYSFKKEDVELRADNGSWHAVINKPQPELLIELLNDGYSLTEWKIRQPNVIEMLCAATGLSIEDVGLEVTSSATIPLRKFGGEEE